MSFLNLLRRRRVEKKQNIKTDYEQLVDDLEAGRHPDPEYAEMVLAKAGKTEDDVEGELATRALRKKYAAVVQRGDEARRQLKTIGPEFEQIKSRYQAATDLFNKDKKDWEARRDSLRGLVREGESAYAKMRDASPKSAKYEAARMKYKEAATKRGKLDRKVQSLESELQGLQKSSADDNSSAAAIEALQSRLDEARVLLKSANEDFKAERAALQQARQDSEQQLVG